MRSMGINPEQGIIIPHADTRATRDPALRAAMERFVSGLTTETIEDSLSGLLAQPASPGGDYEPTLQDSITTFIDQDVVALIPGTADPYALSRELLQLNHTNLWFDLLHRGVKQDPELEIDLITAFPTVEQNSLLLHTSRYVAS